MIDVSLTEKLLHSFKIRVLELKIKFEQHTFQMTMRIFAKISLYIYIRRALYKKHLLFVKGCQSKRK